MNSSIRPIDGRTFWQRHPLVGMVVALLLIGTPIVGFFVGFFFSRVIPTDLGIDIGLTVGGVYGLAWVVLIEQGIRRSAPNSVAIQNLYSKKLLRSVWFRVPLALFMGLMIGYAAFAWGYLWLFNLSVGVSTTKTVLVTGWDSGSRKSCEHPKIALGIFVQSPRALCVNSEAHARMPNGSKIILEGPSTILGMNVQEIYSFSDDPRL